MTETAGSFKVDLFLEHTCQPGRPRRQQQQAQTITSITFIKLKQNTINLMDCSRKWDSPV